MTDPDLPDAGPPDDVPLADAVEQSRPVTGFADPDNLDPEERVPVGDEAPPLESDESDWREQHVAVDDPEDDFR